MKQVKRHAASLDCNGILGYDETASIHDDIMVLTCTGTAAYIKAEVFFFNSYFIALFFPSEFSLSFAYSFVISFSCYYF
jgi:hypothetical protein